MEARASPILFVSPKRGFVDKEKVEKLVEKLAKELKFPIQAEIGDYELIYQKIIDSQINQFIRQFSLVVIDEVLNSSFLEAYVIYQCLKDLNRIVVLRVKRDELIDDKDSIRKEKKWIQKLINRLREIFQRDKK